MINIAVVGAAGRLGSLIVSSSGSFSGITLCGAIEAASSPVIGKTALSAESNKGTELIYTSDLETALRGADICIECAFHASTPDTARVCAEHGVGLIVLTTGHSDAQRNAILAHASHIPVLIAPNASIGVFVLHQLARLAAQILGADYDVEIAEIHHLHKKDAPSGTALSLAKAIQQERSGEIFTGRNEVSGPRKEGEIGIASLRGGDVPGEHTIYFLGEGDRIELRHNARDRVIFARGALTLAERLAGRVAGSYRVEDLFNTQG